MAFVQIFRLKSIDLRSTLRNWNSFKTLPTSFRDRWKSPRSTEMQTFRTKKAFSTGWSSRRCATRHSISASISKSDGRIRWRWCAHPAYSLATPPWTTKLLSWVACSPAERRRITHPTCCANCRWKRAPLTSWKWVTRYSALCYRIDPTEFFVLSRKTL